MKILLVHQNFPGQYLHLVRHLAAGGGHEIVFITQRRDAALAGVRRIVYAPQRKPTPGLHHYLADAEAAVLNAQEVARVALDLKQSGFIPDVMLGHNGWGEIWYLKDVYPETPLVGYFEFFYRYKGADVGFDPGETLIFDHAPRLRTRNLGNLIALDAVDLGQCPTEWQKSLYPARWHDRLRVVHEGIDTDVVRPDPAARFALPGGGPELGAADEVVSYVARNLEPYRGFHILMRSLPAILERRPRARIVIVGGDETSYGPPPADGGTWRARLTAELGTRIDAQRVHFTGKLPYGAYLRLLQVSSAHVYLTYPFVLSWSMLEAMAAGCILVASRTAPVEEVLRDGENGLLADFFAPEEIAARVCEVLADRPAFAALGANARRTIIERYDLKTVCLPAQLRLVEEATGTRPKRAGFP